MTSVAHAELDTFTYVSNDGTGTGAFEGDISGQGLLTLLDSSGGDMWNDGDNFAYVHEGQTRQRSFRATARVVSQTEAIDGRWGKAGIRASASLGGASAFAMSQVAAGNGSQIDPPAVGDHSPVPVRLAGRTLNQLPNGFEDPVIAAPGTDAPVAGGNVANNVFPATGQSNVSWLSLDYDALSNEFVAGYAIDDNGSPGVWNFSAPRSNIQGSPDGGWYVGLAYSAHNSMDFNQVTRSDNFHGVTFDNFSVVNLPEFVGGEGTIGRPKFGEYQNVTFQEPQTVEGMVRFEFRGGSNLAASGTDGYQWANRAEYETFAAGNSPDFAGLMAGPIQWIQPNYPEEWSSFIPAGTNVEDYSVTITGQMFIDETFKDFKDGNDDYTLLVIDTDGDGDLNDEIEVIDDGDWTNLATTSNSGSPFAFASFTNLPPEGEWRDFLFVFGEGTSGDNAALYWSGNPGFEALPGQGSAVDQQGHLVPASSLRAADVAFVDTADFVADLSGVDVVFDVIVDELEWDKVGLNEPSGQLINQDSQVNGIVTFEGGVVRLELTEDPIPGMTVDLVDNTFVNQIIGPAEFSYSHGDPAMWDTSQFEVNGQLTFGSAPQFIVGDYNGNGTVEQADLDLVLLNWGESFENLPAEWVNQRPTEGIVAQAQLDGVLLNWGNVAALGAAAGVPEPTTLAMLLVAAGLGLGLIRRR